MAVISLENVAATASITIQLIKDYSMYESEIISSNGTIFQSTDTDTTLTFRAYKGIEEITNKLSGIEWSKFYFRDDELVEDSSWGINKKNQKKIVLNKDDIEGKSIIQVSGYSTIDGNRELVTTARITMIKISDVYISDIAPVDPSDKMMWMDTNHTPPTLKIWSDDLGYWLSTGMDIPIVKNLIRNSNFWTDISGYYTVTNSSNINTPVRTIYSNKQWITLTSKNNNSESGGISQEIQYPIVTNSNYIFSFAAYRDTSASYTGKNISIKITSIDSNNRSTVIIDGSHELKTSASVIQVPFTTLNNTSKISIYIGTQRRSMCRFYATELSLYNSSVYYPWELCPEDVDKQIDNKLDNSRLSVFNTLTNNNAYKAIYESGDQYYIRSEYIVPEVALKTDLTTESNKISILQSDITTLQNRLSISENKYSQLETKNSSLQTSLDTLQTSFDTLQTNYNTKITELTNIIKDLTDRIEKLEKNNNNNNTNNNNPQGPSQS